MILKINIGEARNFLQKTINNSQIRFLVYYAR